MASDDLNTFLATSLLEAYSQGLLHKLRSRLALVNNELACLGDGLEIARCRDAVHSLIQLMRQAQIDPIEGDLSSADLGRTIAYLEDCGRVVSVVQGDLPKVALRQVSCDRLWQELIEILRAISLDTAGPMVMQFSAVSSMVVGTCKVQLYASAVWPQLGGLSFSSFTEFLCRELGVENFKVPLIDALVFRVGGAVQISCSKEEANSVVIVVWLPVCQDALCREDSQEVVETEDVGDNNV